MSIEFKCWKNAPEIGNWHDATIKGNATEIEQKGEVNEQGYFIKAILPKRCLGCNVRGYGSKVLEIDPNDSVVLECTDQS